MNCDYVRDHIVNWIKERCDEAQQGGLVVGVSGGVDSGVVSTLCAMTGLPTFLISMPIHQNPDQVSRADEHMKNLEERFSNVTTNTVDLTDTYEALLNTLPAVAKAEIALVNARSRLRMVTLYAFANSAACMVVGTGNRVEDYGIGFFTKYGDGGVDISPIGDLTKTEVVTLARHIEVIESICSATPNDGLWVDGRSDEDQIGATYPELEKAMTYCDKSKISTVSGFSDYLKAEMDPRFARVMKIYLTRHENSAHKMNMPPVCAIPNKEEM